MASSSEAYRAMCKHWGICAWLVCSSVVFSPTPKLSKACPLGSSCSHSVLSQPHQEVRVCQKQVNQCKFGEFTGHTAISFLKCFIVSHGWGLTNIYTLIIHSHPHHEFPQTVQSGVLPASATSGSKQNSGPCPGVGTGGPSFSTGWTGHWGEQ